MLTVVLICVLSAAEDESWREDFIRQTRPDQRRLDVYYRDASREAFQIEAEDYHLEGGLREHPALVSLDTGKSWLHFAVEDEKGRSYAMRHAAAPSRINLYRRGPYYCDVHWLDLTLADHAGDAAPLKGDLALHCYPDAVYASVTWHATEAFPAARLIVEGRQTQRFDMAAFEEGTKQAFPFTLLPREETPLPDSAFRNTSAASPMRYDAVRGCYVIGSRNDGGFQQHFYHHPNRYERAAFEVRNDGVERTIYVCHETSEGGKGSVEGGVLLDVDGHPLPVTVQISKNFGGEKEEPFYHPSDAPFSETWFPLHLAPGETCTVTSLHLYQNWGRHMVKQFSSLGAWMDYWHSSTGVTETTCYVPFKFDGNLRPPRRLPAIAGGLQGVMIADFRAMSQAAFWGGQPQHDNVAGHNFLTYKANGRWEHLVYKGADYISTGPNWMYIRLHFLSSDGNIRATVDTFELPQKDELRNFINVSYSVLRPFTVDNACEDFRLLSLGSWPQGLRYTHYGSSRTPGKKLTFDEDHYAVRGEELDHENAFMALYGEPKGSNAIVLRRWSATLREGELSPAASVWCGKSKHTRLMLTPAQDRLAFSTGDHIGIEAFWMPYGEVYGAETPARECALFGTPAAGGPRIVEVTKGRELASFPATIRAENDEAVFTLAGGRDLIPVTVTNLSGYRWPRIAVQTGGEWRTLSHARVSDLDGVQVFAHARGQYGAVFLVDGGAEPRTYRVTAGMPATVPARLNLRPDTAAEGNALLIQAPWMDAPMHLSFPQHIRIGTSEPGGAAETPSKALPVPAGLAGVWQKSEGGSWWFEWDLDGYLAGGRATPNEGSVDLEIWFHNKGTEAVQPSITCRVETQGTLFGGAPAEEAGHMLVLASQDGTRAFGMAWENAHLSGTEPHRLQMAPALSECPPGKRVFMRGRIYLAEGSADEVLDRARREILAVSP